MSFAWIKLFGAAEYLNIMTAFRISEDQQLEYVHLDIKNMSNM